MHVHVHHANGEAKVWLDPFVEVAEDHGLGARRLKVAVRMIRDHEHEIREAWEAHFER